MTFEFERHRFFLLFEQHDAAIGVRAFFIIRDAEAVGELGKVLLIDDYRAEMKP